MRSLKFGKSGLWGKIIYLLITVAFWYITFVMMKAMGISEEYSLFVSTLLFFAFTMWMLV